MESIASEFAKLFFQPPVLILFALAIVGVSDLISRRSGYRDRAAMEWRLRESWMRGWMKQSPNEELIERARQKFYERKFLKPPKRKAHRAGVAKHC